MKLSGNFRKVEEILLEAKFCKNRTKNIITKNLKYFSQTFCSVLGKLSANCR